MIKQFPSVFAVKTIVIILLQYLFQMKQSQTIIFCFLLKYMKINLETITVNEYFTWIKNQIYLNRTLTKTIRCCANILSALPSYVLIVYHVQKLQPPTEQLPLHKLLNTVVAWFLFTFLSLYTSSSKDSNLEKI